MIERKSHVAEGIVLISIAVAFTLTYYTTYKYYGSILLFCIGGIMIALSFLPKKEERKIPMAGIILMILGGALLIEVLSGGQEVILTMLLLIVVAAAGVRMLFS
ncbi:MAG: hypothetical protein NTZ78_14470 [Candidatus Aureabacteria bacterium]|nr:hypothetical protein [Candidatus Auribacterota bacterium]